MQWQEIVPATPFTAFATGTFSEERMQSMTMLYQPLIGPVAFSLYVTLMTEIEMTPKHCIKGIHKQWMTQTGQHLSMLFEERKKLEAIGLLESYKDDAEEPAMVYELLMPLLPKEFFLDEMLSVYLYNRIGSKERYRKLRGFFTREQVELEKYQRVTKGFSDVFTSVHPSEMKSTSSEMQGIISPSANISGTDKTASYDFQSESVPMQDIAAFLPSFVNRDELFKPANEKCIQQIAFLYKFTAEELAYMIQDTMLHTDYLDIKKLRESAKRKYRLQESDKPPMLGLRTQPPGLHSLKGEPKTEEEAQMHYFDTTSPIEYLHALSDGAKVFPGDIDIIEELMHDYALPAGVVNVLIDYIYMVNNGNLAKAYAFKIATQWKRKKINTVAEAMTLAKQEHEERKNFKQKQTSKTKTQEPLPKWMKSKEETTLEKQAPEEDLTKSKAEAAKYRELLKRKKEKKG
ncbi:replication initiation and membrane attachment family protein [Alkalicoccus daliensis]|uniref:Replicative DNA helicase loader DnaB n=1 Tax=Alkalicoccus daliensis TaxID=745820 RepID=A0A1H0CEA2_9BACI|nr:DnaD domain protein [Alkalicoccus daliensis]SDN56190.1 replicative DNA helicase loader DnaB [Alkalicoccus daliensis]